MPSPTSNLSHPHTAPLSPPLNPAILTNTHHDLNRFTSLPSTIIRPSSSTDTLTSQPSQIIHRRPKASPMTLILYNLGSDPYFLPGLRRSATLGRHNAEPTLPSISFSPRTFVWSLAALHCQGDNERIDIVQLRKERLVPLTQGRD